MKVAVISLLFGFLVCSAFAHDWMEIPTAHNGGVAQQAGVPCDPLTATSAVNNVVQGADVLVQWSNGHKEGLHNISLASFGNDATISEFTLLASVPASQTAQPQDYTVPGSYFSKYSYGTKLTLRYAWYQNPTTLWDNCATLLIVAPTPSGAVQAAATAKNPITNQPIQPGDYLLQNGNTTIGVFNIYNGNIVCASGYHADGNRCVSGAASSKSSGGLSGAAKFFIALFVISAVGVAAFGIYFTSHHATTTEYGVKPHRVSVEPFFNPDSGWLCRSNSRHGEVGHGDLYQRPESGDKEGTRASTSFIKAET